MKFGIIVIIFTFIGFGLRYSQIDRYLWVDEALFAHLVKNNQHPHKEIIPFYIEKLIQSKNRQQMRLQFILFSTLSIPAIFFVLKDKKKALIIAGFVAILPLYTYWGSMARPYCVGAFFAILGYRWPVFYIPAILTTPISITAINLWKVKERWIFYLIIIISAIAYYYSMSYIVSVGHHKSLEHLYNAKRFWYIPTIGILLNLGDFDLGRISRLLETCKRLVSNKRM